ncbi:MAG: hypothetical protein AAF063_29920 [Cyanobacteria bacterium J06643_5]
MKYSSTVELDLYSAIGTVVESGNITSIPQSEQFLKTLKHSSTMELDLYSAIGTVVESGNITSIPQSEQLSKSKLFPHRNSFSKP